MLPITIEKINNRYLLLYKANLMCLAAKDTLDDILLCARNFFIKAHGDLETYLTESMYSLEYSPKPPTSVYNARKSALTDEYDNYLIGVFNAAETALVSSKPTILAQPTRRAEKQSKTLNRVQSISNSSSKTRALERASRSAKKSTQKSSVQKQRIQARNKQRTKSALKPLEKNMPTKKSVPISLKRTEKLILDK